MRFQWPVGVALLFVFFFLPGARAGDGSRFEDIVKQMLGTMENLTSTLSTVRDEETAKAAIPELRKAAGLWATVKKKAEALPPPPKEEKDRLAKLYKTKLEEAQKKLFGEVQRVQAVPGGRAALL